MYSSAVAGSTWSRRRSRSHQELRLSRALHVEFGYAVDMLPFVEVGYVPGYCQAGRFSILLESLLEKRMDPFAGWPNGSGIGIPLCNGWQWQFQHRYWMVGTDKRCGCYELLWSGSGVFWLHSNFQKFPQLQSLFR